MKYLSQRDPKWATKKLGNTFLTVGRWGCTTTCVSMLSSLFGGVPYKDPGQLAADAQLYNAEGLILWNQLPRIFNGKLSMVARIQGMNRKAIADSIAGAKTAVILEVANHSHWVVAHSPYGKDFYCIDPLDGKKKLALKTFGNITGSAHIVVA